MDITRATLETCAEATGTVVVIDVLRSFTTAAFAFAAGARAILPVSTIADAQALRAQFPNTLAMGALGGGWPIAGFDLSNSPAALVGRDLVGRQIIHCTAAGIQGLVRSRRAARLLASSIVCASATACYLRRLAPPAITLVITGNWSDRDGDEDNACADYIEALLHGESPDPAPFAERVRTSDFGRRFTDPNHAALPAADLDYCADVNRFDFALLVRRHEDLLVMEPVTG